MSDLHPRTVAQSITDAYRHLFLAQNQLSHLRVRPESDIGVRLAADKAHEAVTIACGYLRMEYERITRNNEGGE